MKCQELEEIMGQGASHRGIYVSFFLSSLKNLSLFKLFSLYIIAIVLGHPDFI